ncbi:MAG: T9SS type A sorting domain-containing protein [Saprospiraceae bacterium]|nr:T9SS type A sorting domain-containing protein [Saprospiraceae bacterium]
MRKPRLKFLTWKSDGKSSGIPERNWGSRFYSFMILLGALMFSTQQANAQCFLSCVNRNVSVDENCEATITWSDIAVVASGCSGTYRVRLMNEAETIVYAEGVNSVTISGDDFDECGGVYKVEIRDNTSGNRCWSYVTIEDKLPPAFAPGLVNIGTSAWPLPVEGYRFEFPCSYTHSQLNSLVLTGLAATDNCDASLTYEIQSETFTDFGCNDVLYENYFSARLDRKYIAIDNCGNRDTTNVYIFFKRLACTDVTFPSSWDGLPGGHNVFECNGNLSVIDNKGTVSLADDVTLTASSFDSNGHISPSYTGSPSINGVALWPSNNSLCEINATYNDQVIDICPGTYKILRTWTVFNWCTGQICPGPLQVIKVVDSRPPTLNGGAPTITAVGTSGSTCQGSVTIPAASFNDRCSDASISVVMTYNGINYNGAVSNTINNVSSGSHTVVYTATDGCGNSTSVSVPFEVQDDDAPVAICQEATTVGLSSTQGGTTTICASSLNSGSYDNCSNIVIKIKRMGSSAPFSDCIDVSCADIGTPVQVRFRAYDLVGNGSFSETEGRYSECMVLVTVQDKIKPILTCPANKILNCGQDPFDTAITGVATATDNCNVTVTSTTTGSVNTCGVGTITRTWTASDAAGNTTTCSQTITVSNNSPFSASNIVWPTQVVTVSNCTQSTTPEGLNAINTSWGFPTYTQVGCSNIVSSHEDIVLTVQAPGCMKILRKWIIVDWCRFNVNGPLDATNAYYTFTQEIRVMNNVPPTIATCPADFTVSATGNNCSGSVTLSITATDDCTLAQDLRYSWAIDANNDGSTNFTGSTSTATGTYPIGTHKITWTVADGCGNATTCSYRFTIRDNKKPTPVCFFGLSTDLTPMDTNNDGTPDTAMVTLWGVDFLNVASSFDDCSDINLNDVRVRRIAQLGVASTTPPPAGSTSITFSCADQGIVYLQIWLRDGSGNWDYCETYMYITANMGGCAPRPSTNRVAGSIQTEEGENVEQVNVNVQMVENSSPVSVLPTQTADGHFTVLVEPGHDYVVNPEKLEDPLNGVTTLDLVLINKHILGVLELNTPYKKIAADANNSRSITTLDLVELRKLILGINPALTSNTSWRFIDASFQFPNPSNPWSTVFPEVYNINNLQTDMMSASFKAVKIGDVNSSASTSLTSIESGNRNANNFNLLVDDVELVEGQTYNIPVMAAKDAKMLGYQFTLDFNPSVVEFIAVEAEGSLKGNSIDNFGVQAAERGKLTTSWNANETTQIKGGQQLFALTFVAKANGKLSDFLAVNSDITKAEAYNASLETMNVNLEFGVRTKDLTSTFELFQNQPNPFKNETIIGFNLPESSSATLSVFDMSGKLIKSVAGDYKKGYNEIKLNKNELNSSGMLYYQLETKSNTATKKMLLVD